MTEVMNPFHTHTVYNSPPSSPSAHSHTGSTDWKQKYFEVSDLLAETRAELDDFTRTSKELEEELERDLERTEKAQEELRMKVTKVEGERDEWKSKFMNLQQTHNTTTNSLQRELDATRQSLQLYKAQVRELELGNDDLERNERQATSSLVDVEQKYAKALEDKILLEHELQDKAVLEETCQRLRDELRDANVEISVLKDQMEQFKQLPLRPTALERQTSSSSSLPLVSPTGSEGDNLIRTPAPDDISFADLQTSTPIASSASTPSIRSSRQSRFSQDIFDEFAMSRGSPTPFSAKSLPSRSNTISTPTPQESALQRALSPSSTATSMSTATRLPTPRQRTLGPSPTAQPSPRIPVPTRTTAASRSRGVQMVSEMRARVKTLEQKIHTNMPRLRVTNANDAKSAAPGRPRAASRAASVAPNNVRTPKKSFAVPKEPASPWVMVADDGAANITIHQPESPDRPPRLPALPDLSPIASAPLPGLDVSTTSMRPPSRTTLGFRSVSAMARPNFAMTARSSEESTKNVNNKLLGHPTTTFPTLANKKDHPPRSTSAAGNFKPPSRIVAFATAAAAASTAAANVKATPTSPPAAARPTTPPLQTQAAGLRRSYTTSSPSRPPTIAPSLSPRKRVDSVHSSKANTRDAGTTPGRFAKARVVTSPDTPPPMPAMPVAHVKNNLVLGQTKIGAPSVLTKSRIGRPGSSGKTLSEFGAL
ncbi:NADH:ubiquinone oxidoreductase [Tulasnella sp. 408]|nr:NADH:ubiquinone oxidoreductase [Tulasnella sp. 408]